MINQTLFKQLMRDSGSLLGNKTFSSSLSPFNLDDILLRIANSSVTTLVMSVGDNSLISLLNELFSNTFEISVKSYSAGEGDDPSLDSDFMHRCVVRHSTGGINQIANILILKASSTRPFIFPICDDIVCLHDRSDYFNKAGFNIITSNSMSLDSSSYCLELLSELVFKMVKEEGAINDGVVKVIGTICSLPNYCLTLSTVGFLDILVLESNMKRDAVNPKGGGHGAFGLFQFRDVSLAELHRKGIINVDSVDDIQAYGYRSQLWLALAYIFDACKGRIHPNFLRNRFIGFERLLCYAPNKFKREDPVLYMYTAVSALEKGANSDESMSKATFINDVASLGEYLSSQVSDFLTVSPNERDVATLDKIDSVVDREAAIDDRSLHCGAFVLSNHYLHNSKFLASPKSSSANSNNRFFPMLLACNLDSIFADLFSKGAIKCDVFVMSYSKQVGPNYLGFKDWILDPLVNRPHAHLTVNSSMLRGAVTGLQAMSDLLGLGVGHIKDFMSEMTDVSNMGVAATGVSRFREGKMVEDPEASTSDVLSACDDVLYKYLHVGLGHRYKLMIMPITSNGLIKQGSSIMNDDSNEHVKATHAMLDDISKITSVTLQRYGKQLLPNKLNRSGLTNTISVLKPLGSFLRGMSHPVVSESPELASDQIISEKGPTDDRGISFIKW